MARSPEPTAQFRAPPPSPISSARGRRTADVDDDDHEDLTDFLDCSLRVPDLILPDRIFPHEIPMIDPPEIDFRSLISTERQDPSLSKRLEYAAGFGCFQLVNHGIPNELIELVKSAAAGVFEISDESKETVKRSPERRYGFEEVSCEEEEEGDVCEEFYWCRNEEKEEAKALMEGIWPNGFSNFSRRTEEVWKEIEKVARRITESLVEASGGRDSSEAGGEIITCEEMATPVLCLCKHGRNVPDNRELSSLKSDVIRMLIRRSDYPHALCVHACDGASEFHVYSSRIGWMSFSPDKEALLVTIGDQMQVWTDGLFRHAVGRPIFHVEDEDPISMAFIYTPTTVGEHRHSSSTALYGSEKTISVRQQVMAAICLTLVYHLLLHIYNMMAVTT